jgi:hypothetical protein
MINTCKEISNCYSKNLLLPPDTPVQASNNQ